MGSDAKILFTCPACGARARIPGRFAAKRIHCPHCTRPVTVGAPPIANAPEPEAPAPAVVAPIARQAEPTAEPVKRTFLFACPGCPFYAQVPMRADGKQLRCPRCGHSSLAGAATKPSAPKPAPVQEQQQQQQQQQEQEQEQEQEPVQATSSAPARISGRYASSPSARANAPTVRIASSSDRSRAVTRRIVASPPDAGVWSSTPAPSPIHVEVGAADSGSEEAATTEDGQTYEAADDDRRGSDAAENDASAEPTPSDDREDGERDDGEDDHDDEVPGARTRAARATTVRVHRRSVSETRPSGGGGRRLVRGMLLIAIAAIGVGGWTQRERALELAATWRPAAVAPAAEKPVDPTAPIRSSGVVVANAEIDVVAAASGTIARLPFAIGDHVTAGAVVAEVDPAIETAEVRRAQAQAALSQGMLAQARHNLVLAESRLIADRSASEADLAGAQSRARDAAARAERQQQLLTRTLSSQADADSARELSLQADAEVAAATARIAQSDAERAGLDIQRQEIAIAEAQALTDQLTLDQARARLAATSVTAPITGVIAASHANVGASVIEGTGLPLMTLSDVSRLFVTTQVCERDLGRIAIGQAAAIHVPAYPDRSFTGRVERIATCGDAGDQGATFHVRIEAIGEGVELLRPAMNAEVGFEPLAPILARKGTAP